MTRFATRFTKMFGMSALTLFATAAAAQAWPDFSGRWTAPPEPPAASGGRGSIAAGTTGSGWGGEIAIVQDATTLTVERAQFSQYDMQPPMRFVYALDGSESRNTINMGRGPQEVVSTASRQDASVVIVTTYRFSHPQDGRREAMEVRQVLSLDVSGSLVITATRSGLAGNPASTSTTTYKKH